MRKFLNSCLQVKLPDEPMPEEVKANEKIRELFKKLAGEDMEVDWMELKEILDYAMRNGECTVFISI